MGKTEVLPAMHALPPLPYAYDALEPHIDARTMLLHHDQHHVRTWKNSMPRSRSIRT